MLKNLSSRLVPIWGQVKAARDWLTLLAVASAAAFLWFKFSTVQRDRDGLQAFAMVACATAGEPFAANLQQVAGKRPTLSKRGELCLQRVARLVAFEGDATRASNDALAGALRDHANKSELDAELAARDARAAASSAERMERANNDVPPNDSVGRDWFDSLNGLGGLRPPTR